jgi:DNA-binding PucR family transcriptional regulator
VCDNPETQRLAAEILRPIRQYDLDHGGDLLHTMRTYYECAENASRAAERLFLHRNGLLYRLGRVERLLNVSLGDRDVSVSLQLALRLDATQDDQR